MMPKQPKNSRKRRKSQPLDKPNPAMLAFWATVIAALISAVAQFLK
jgi:hypothetical protein